MNFNCYSNSKLEILDIKHLHGDNSGFILNNITFFDPIFNLDNIIDILYRQQYITNKYSNYRNFTIKEIKYKTCITDSIIRKYKNEKLICFLCSIIKSLYSNFALLYLGGGFIRDLLSNVSSTTNIIDLDWYFYKGYNGSDIIKKFACIIKIIYEIIFTYPLNCDENILIIKYDKNHNRYNITLKIKSLSLVINFDINFTKNKQYDFEQNSLILYNSYKYNKFFLRNIKPVKKISKYSKQILNETKITYIILKLINFKLPKSLLNIIEKYLPENYKHLLLVIFSITNNKLIYSHNFCKNLCNHTYNDNECSECISSKKILTNTHICHIPLYYTQYPKGLFCHSYYNFYAYKCKEYCDKCYNVKQCKNCLYGKCSYCYHNVCKICEDICIREYFRKIKFIKRGWKFIDVKCNNCNEKFIKLESKIQLLISKYIKYMKKNNYSDVIDKEYNYLTMNRLYNYIINNKKPNITNNNKLHLNNDEYENYFFKTNMDTLKVRKKKLSKKAYKLQKANKKLSKKQFIDKKNILHNFLAIKQRNFICKKDQFNYSNLNKNEKKYYQKLKSKKKLYNKNNKFFNSYFINNNNNNNNKHNKLYNILTSKNYKNDYFYDHNYLKFKLKNYIPTIKNLFDL